MTLDLPTLLNLISTAAIVLGVLFGLFELRQALKDRRAAVAFEIAGGYQTPEVRRAMARVMTLPVDADPDLVNGNPDVLSAALAADSLCEAWGSMVYEGVIELHMLDRMAGGQIRGSWIRLRRWVEHERSATGIVNLGEWWQWVYERIVADPDPGKAAGAHVSFKGRPRR
jgi:hypothetical protein